MQFHLSEILKFAAAAVFGGLLVGCARMALKPAEPPPKPTRFSFLRADGTRTVDEQGSPVVLRGCNLGNWLLLEMWMMDYKEAHDQFTFEEVLAQRFGADGKDRLMEIFRENWITERDFQIIPTFGFNVVRLPFNYTLLMDDAKPYELKPDAFQWLDRAVALARENGLYTILDMHGVPGRQSVDHTTGRSGQNRVYTDPEMWKQTVWLWKEIAAHFRDVPEVAALEPINEPFGDYKTDAHLPALARLIDDIYKAIREVDTRHIIVIPGSRQGIQFYGKPADRGWQNVMFTEHYYPGVHWGEPGLQAHREHINRLLPGVERYLDYVSAPFLVGEFNVVFRRGGGPMMMRRYYDFYEARGWWGTMWTYKITSWGGGLAKDPWYMVSNRDPLPAFSIRHWSEEQLAEAFRHLGTLEYAVYDELREALASPTPAPLAIDDPANPSEAPFNDPLGAWQATDIASRPAGGQKVYSPTRMDIYGGGRDLWNRSDEFRLVWQGVAGDFEIRATLEDFADTNPYAKAGLMIRGSVAPDAPHVLLHVFPDAQVVLGWRPEAGAESQEQKSPVVQFPVHLRLKRTGSLIEGLYSADGVHWFGAGQVECGWLSTNAVAGMAVLSHDDRYLAKAAFNNIELRRKESP